MNEKLLSVFFQLFFFLKTPRPVSREAQYIVVILSRKMKSECDVKAHLDG